MERLIQFCLRSRLLVLVLGALVLAGGYYSYRRLPVDAFPDVSPVLVQIFVETEGLAPEEVDQIADQMLTRLAVTEERPRFFDPDDLPGGKFVFMAGCGFAVLVLLIVLYTVFGLFLGRS